MYKRINQAVFALFCMLMAASPSWAAGLIDTAAVATAEADILLDVATVAGLCITVMLALIGFAWAMRAGRKGGG